MNKRPKSMLVMPQKSEFYECLIICPQIVASLPLGRNRLKTAITEGEYFLQQSQKWPKDARTRQQRIDTQANETKARMISKTLDTLISWFEHDVLNKAGPTKNQRRELYDFVVEEFKKLEVIEPHRISVMRITLENKREAALGFVDVLEVKFAAIGDQFSISMESV